MAFWENDKNSMQQNYDFYAIIELDDLQKTGSDGGVILEVVEKPKDLPYESWKVVNIWNERYKNKTTIIKKVTFDVRPGWIMQSKTGAILDSNK
jgi:hypothetical protein